MSLQIINRRGYLHEWNQAEAASPPKGNLRRGEIAIAIVTDDGTENGDIVEVIGRIGPSDTPTPFSDCPVVFRSPRGFKGADVRPVLVDDEPQVDSVLAYDATNNKFVSLNEDPGTYEEDDDTDGDGGEGGGGELSEVSPSILVLSATGLTGSATAGTRAGYTLSMEVVGRPDPILSIEIIERDYPDATNGFNYTETTAYTFTTDNLPQNVTVTTSTDSSISTALGATNYTISGLGVLRAEAIEKVGVSVRVSGSNTAGESPVTEFAAGSIAVVADPIGETPEPRVTKVAISEGGSEKAKIPNLATDGAVTLTANVTTEDFTAGVANGTIAYQWFSDGAALVGETGQTVTLTNTSDTLNDTQISVAVTIADDNGTDSRTGYIEIGDVDSGFTELTPSADSRLIYVAANGDDAAAANNQHGRAYYLPSDPEIGPDPMNPVGPITAYATHFEAAKRVRLSRAVGEDSNGFPLYDRDDPLGGFPDWILLRRGDNFTDDPELPDPNNNPVTYDLGGLLGGPTGPGQGWDQSRNGGRIWYYCGPWRGRSASEPSVVTAWGPTSDPRPVLSGFSIAGGTRHVRITSLEVPKFRYGRGGDVQLTSGDVLIEDVKMTSLGPIGTVAAEFAYETGLTIRRSLIADLFSPTGHNSGFFVDSLGSKVTFEECVIDRCGYKEDPNEPTTWTRSVRKDDQQPGEGVQPKRTYFDRNIYGARYANLTLRGNVVSRGGGGSSVQMRVGGVAERNLFIFNAQALAFGGSEAYEDSWNDAIVVDNLVLHDEMFVPPGGFGTGISVRGYERSFVVSDNVIAHFHSYNNGGGALWFAGKPQSNKSRAAMMTNLISKNNVVDNRYGASGFYLEAYYDSTVDPIRPWGIDAMTVDDNDVRVLEVYNPFLNQKSGRIVGGDFRDAPTASILWGADAGNRYASDRTNVVMDRDDPGKALRDILDFSQYQAKGYGANSTFTTDQAAFEAAAGWTDPERDIVGYMQAVDPTYVVNEDVYVDEGASGQKQAVRQKVWEALDEGSGDPVREAWAKTAARRYHAFLAFIEKARANRKGAWDSRWTADAVNNYIREGYGKAPVGGPYTTTIDDLATYGA